MIRTTLALYLTIAAAIGPSVCCILNGGVETASWTAFHVTSIVVNRNKACCEREGPVTASSPYHNESNRDSTKVCHNMSREYIAGETFVVPTDFAGELLPVAVDMIHCTSDMPGNNAFAGLDGLAMPKAMHILRC
jgi:hypothetical protein